MRNINTEPVQIKRTNFSIITIDRDYILWEKKTKHSFYLLFDSFTYFSLSDKVHNTDQDTDEHWEGIFFDGLENKPIFIPRNISSLYLFYFDPINNPEKLKGALGEKSYEYVLVGKEYYREEKQKISTLPKNNDALVREVFEGFPEHLEMFYKGEVFVQVKTFIYRTYYKDGALFALFEPF